MLFSYHFPHALARVGPSFVLQIMMIRGFFSFNLQGSEHDVNLESRLQWQNRLLSFVHQPLLSPELPPFGQTWKVILNHSSFFSVLFGIFFSISPINIIMTGKVFVVREWLRKSNISGRHLTGCLKVLGFVEIFLRPEIWITVLRWFTLWKSAYVKFRKVTS